MTRVCKTKLTIAISALVAVVLTTSVFSTTYAMWSNIGFSASYSMSVGSWKIASADIVYNVEKPIDPTETYFQFYIETTAPGQSVMIKFDGNAITYSVKSDLAYNDGDLYVVADAGKYMVYFDTSENIINFVAIK